MCNNVVFEDPSLIKHVTNWLVTAEKFVENKEFYRIKRISDIYSLGLDKIVVSKSIPCNKAKDQRYEVGYKDDDQIVTLYIKTPPKMFSYGVSQYSENSAWTMGFNLENCEEWVNDYRKIWNAVEDQLFVSFTSEPVKERCYLNSKLNVRKEKIKTDFHGKNIPYNQCYEATALLKVKSVYKQGSNHLHSGVCRKGEDQAS